MSDKQSEHDPSDGRMTTDRFADFVAAADAQATLSGATFHLVKVDPATNFKFRYQSREGDVRIIRLHLGGVSPELGSSPEDVVRFHVATDPIEKPTSCTIYAEPEIPLSAFAGIVIEDSVFGDRFVCSSPYLPLGGRLGCASFAVAK